MNKELLIREYESGDFGGLIRLLSDVYGSKVTQDVLETEYLSDGKHIIVAVRGDELIGCSFVSMDRDYIRESLVAFVTYVAVDSRLRKSGIGSKMFDYIEALAVKNGCGSIELTSADYREDAHAFYKALGFSNKKTTVFIKEI